MVVVPVRMTPTQKAKLKRIGGGKRLRQWIDAVPEPGAEEEPEHG